MAATVTPSLPICCSWFPGFILPPSLRCVCFTLPCLVDECTAEGGEEAREKSGNGGEKKSTRVFSFYVLIL